MYFLYKNRTFVEKKLCRRQTCAGKNETVPVTRLPPILNQYLNQSPNSKRKSEFRHNDSSSLDMYPSDQSLQSKRSISSLGNAEDRSSDDESCSSTSGSSSGEKPPKEPAAEVCNNNTRPVKSANPRMSAPIISDQQDSTFRPATSRPKPKGSNSNSKDKSKEQGSTLCYIYSLFSFQFGENNNIKTLYLLFELRGYFLRAEDFRKLACSL